MSKLADNNYLKELNWEQMPQLMLFLRCKDKLEVIKIDKILEIEIERLKKLYGEESISSIINEQDENGNSLIMYLCAIRELNSLNFKLIKSVLKYNPNLNLKNKNGNTILHIMINKSDIYNEIKYETKIIELLITNNINTFIRDDYYNMIPLEYIEFKQNKLKYEYLKYFYGIPNFVKYEYLDNFYQLLEYQKEKKLLPNLKKLQISKLPICEDLMLQIVNLI